MTRPRATPEEEAVLERPDELAALVRADRWPFVGRQIECGEWTASLSGGTIAGTDLLCAEMAGVQWRALTVRDCRLEIGSARGAVFEQVTFEDCALDLDLLADCRFDRATFTRCTLSGTRMTSTQFTACRFVDCTLRRVHVGDQCRLTGVTVERGRAMALTTGVIALEQCTLTGWRLEGARTGTGSRFLDVTLKACDLLSVELTRPRLVTCTLEQGTMSNASISEGDVEQLTLRGLTRIMGGAIVASLVSGLRWEDLPDMSHVSILRSVAEGWRVARCTVRGLSFEGSRVAPATVEVCDLWALDLTATRVEGLAMRGGAIHGTVPADGAVLRGWTLDGTALDSDTLMLAGAAIDIADSDFRIRPPA
jgi:uncharacterized protein YjbI with pentapeptide repeats